MLIRPDLLSVALPLCSKMVDTLALASKVNWNFRPLVSGL
jgi:hypothetical protein